METRTLNRSACKFALVAAMAAWPVVAAANTTPHAGMLRHPAISDSRIAFIYANQIWTAPRSGGTASLVASPPARPMLPRFSPDGKTIAFGANFDGNQDLYTVQVAGGELTRVTHHPSDEVLCGWRDDKSLLFFARGVSESGPGRITRLYSIAAAGGLPEKLPMPYSGFAAVSGDGKTVAFSPLSTDDRTWRRYRGGMAPDLWTMDIATGQSKQITDWEGTDTIPMWGHNRASHVVYYLSDAGPEHRLNIWSYDTQSGQRQQVTKFADDEVRYPSIGPGAGDARGKGEIVFQLGSKLMLLDLDTGESRAVNVTIPGARPRLRPQLKDASERITAADLSPSGKRVVFTGRGDVFSVPVKDGPTRNLTRTDGVFERDASWSPDGRWIAYFADETGEYQLYLRPSDARPAEKKKKDDAEDKGEAAADEPAMSELPQEAIKISDLPAGFRFNPQWSPDSKKIAFFDQLGTIMIAELTFDAASGKLAASEVRHVDQDPWEAGSEISWSHDSNWLAYTRTDEGLGKTALWVYNVGGKTKTRLTDPYFAATSPAFDRKGEFLYYIAGREYSSPKYADYDTTFVYAGLDRLMMVSLRKDVKSPLAPKSDEEEIKPAKKSGDKKSDEKKEKDKGEDKDGNGNGNGNDKDKDKGKAEDDKPLVIDLGDFEARARQLPIAAGNYRNLAVNDAGKLLYITAPTRGNEGRPAIKLFDPTDDKKEEQTVTEGVGNFSMNAGGDKLLIRRNDRWQVIDAAAGGDKKPQDISTSAMTATVNPRAEWKQLFNDAWRIQRDYFYVKNMHGVDWPKIRDQYAAMLDDAASREDVTYILAEMISQLNIGHAYITSPGEIDQAESVAVGLLACDFELGKDGASGGMGYRFKKIYQGAAWDADARSPLALSEPEKDRIVEGEYLLAVNGVDLDIGKDPYAAFIGLADRPTVLTVNVTPLADGGERHVLVTPVNPNTDQSIRFRAWIETNRAYVAKVTDGKVGYIYVPNTGVEGQNELFRQFFGQRDRAALIIDERWNGGGQIPTRFVELLNRPITNYWANRSGVDTTWPPDGHYGRKCMLVNGQAGSGGDMFPWLFKSMNLGKVIGMRTWGGLVGISGNPQLIDGGAVSVPTFGFYKKDGSWGVEGHGVDPDIVVVDDPGKMIGGGPENDPQLLAGISHMLEELKNNPYAPPQRPADPDRRGMGVPERDR